MTMSQPSFECRSIAFALRRSVHKKHVAGSAGLFYCSVLGLVFFWLLLGSATGRALDKEAGSDVNINYPDQLDARSFWPEKSLEHVFATYWSKRFAKVDPEKLMALEAPHFQEMVPLERYRNFMQHLPRGSIQEIEIVHSVQVTKYLFEMSMRIRYIGADDQQRSFSLRDRWVQVHGMWYHLLRDPLIFPQLGQNYPGPKIYNLVSG